MAGPRKSGRQVPDWMDPADVQGEPRYLILAPQKGFAIPKNAFLIEKSLSPFVGPIEPCVPMDQGARYLMKIRSREQFDKLLAIKKLIDDTPVQIIPIHARKTAQCGITYSEARRLYSQNGESGVQKRLTSAQQQHQQKHHQHHHHLHQQQQQQNDKALAELDAKIEQLTATIAYITSKFNTVLEKYQQEIEERDLLKSQIQSLRKDNDTEHADLNHTHSNSKSMDTINTNADTNTATNKDSNTSAPVTPERKTPSSTSTDASTGSIIKQEISPGNNNTPPKVKPPKGGKHKSRKRK